MMSFYTSKQVLQQTICVFILSCIKVVATDNGFGHVSMLRTSFGVPSATQSAIYLKHFYLCFNENTFIADRIRTVNGCHALII